jgi:hypothetical protein
VLGSDESDWTGDISRALSEFDDPSNLATGNPTATITNVAETVWEKWRRELSKLGGTNPLLHFPSDVAIELSTGHPGGLARFFAGTPTLLRNLVRDDVALHRARQRASRINDKAVELAAARGIDSVFLAVGLVSWTNGDEHFTAPMLLRPISMHRKGDDLEVQLTGALHLNPALARELAYQFGVALDERAFVALTNDNGSFRPNGALDRLHGLIAHIDGAMVVPTLAIANLSDVASNMVSAARILDHPLLDTIGGNPNAQGLITESHAAVDPGNSDTRSLDTDSLLLDADAEQERIIAHIVAGNSIVVGTPSGSGATQTIVNAVGELIRSGKRVLVAGPRRARLDDIRRTLGALGLDGLGASPSAIKADLIRSISRIEKTPVPNTMDVDTALLRMRSVISDYRTALNQPDPRFRVSVLDAIRELARLANTTDATNEVSLDVESVIALTSTMDEVVGTILAAADLGQFQSARAASPWATAHFDNAEQASAAFHAATRLDTVGLATLEGMVVEILEPTPVGTGSSLEDLKYRLDTLRGVSAALDKFTPELFDRSIDDFVAAYGPKTRDDAMPGAQRRRLKKLAKEFVRPGAHVPDMLGALTAASVARTQWNTLVNAAYRPSVPAGFVGLGEQLDQVLSDIALLNGPLARRLDVEPRSVVSELVTALAADSTSIDTVHERSAIVDSMRVRGLEGLLHVFAGRIVTREIITAELQLAWWRGVLEAIIADRGQLLGADTTILDRLENDFRLVDQAHITGNAQKLAHSLAEAWRIAITDLPDETSAIKTALTVGPTSVSNLVAVAPTLTDILAPVWCISPYEIGTLAPNQRFDVVILVDAGAMSVAEVAPAISRGDQIVTFGDPVTDRPTSFTVTPDDSVDAGLGSRSVLAELAQILPTHAMTMSYRPLGTGLAAQISTQFYVDGLRTWPLASASLGESGLSFINVEGKGPLDEKTGRIEATATELDAIVANVVEHATLHPEHSLMVISASSITVARVQDAIHSALPANRTLQDFFTRHADSPFVVLSLQQASAVTRDRVIFALGFGRSPHGRVLSDLGALSTEDGERLIAVAMTRATRHLTVISALSTAELRDERMSKGVNALGRFIDETLAFVPHESEQHPLMHDLGTRLSTRGMTLLTDVPGVPLAARLGDNCVAIDIDDNIMPMTLREGLRIRPDMLARCGWRYARIHELQLFLSPDLVADQIERILRDGQEAA